MKKLVLIIAVLLSTYVSTAQNFDKYENMKDVKSMVVTSKMFKLLTKIDLDSNDPETQQYIDLIENLDNIKVFATESQSLRSQMKADVTSYLSSSSLDELMRFNDDGKSVKLYSKPGKNSDYVKEVFMFIDGIEDGKPMSVVVQIKGDLSLKQIGRLAEDLNITGADQLKKVSKSK
ncbi:DUF4252 domain-containing protein [Gangjinia marincola]